MKKSKFLRSVSSFLVILTVFTSFSSMLASCGKDELGKRYSSKTEGKDAAVALVADGKAASDAISDIEYEIALMIHSEYGDKVYDLGVKNVYYATDRNTEDTEVYCTKTYYGTEGNEIAAYYRHDGYLYSDFCNTLIRSPMTEAEFYDYVDDTALTASVAYFKPSNFSSGCVYGYSDGTESAFFFGCSAELTDAIAGFLGLSGGSYVYEFSDVMLHFEVNAEGEIRFGELSLSVEYHESISTTNVVSYDGSFTCDILNVGDQVSVRVPQAGVEYQTVSDFEKLRLITKGYETLTTITSISADYYRKVTNEDISGNIYKLESQATFTQKYKDDVYTYGSIDVEKGSTPKGGDTLTSVGLFVTPDGKYHYKDLENNDKTEENEASVKEWLATFSATLTEEMFYESDISNLTVSETEDIITFTYEYSRDVLESYATYLLDAFANEQGNISIGGQIVNPIKNKGVIKVRLSDGCLIYHSVEFQAMIGYSIQVSGEYVLDIKATGDSVDVLDLSDWEKHEMKFN